MNNKTILIILGTVIVIGLILLVSNINVLVNINKKGDQNSTSQNVQGGQNIQTDSMDSMHGGAAADSTVFNSLLNKPAPDFTLESYDGKKIALRSLKGKNVILFFNEGLMCYPACWNQIAMFGKDSQLQSKAVILNITVDPQNQWKQAVDKMPELLRAIVLFDSNKQVSSSYGTLALPSSMHKGKLPGHTYFLIDKEGIIRYVYDDPQMAIRDNELSAQIDKL